MDFFPAISAGFRNCAKFSGRATRSEYWYWALFVGLATSAAQILDQAFSPNELIVIGQIGPIYLLAAMAVIVPGVAVAVRRLHDVDRTGWWLLLWLTIVGGLLLLYWFCKRGTVGPNRFGPDPLPAPGFAASQIEGHAKQAYGQNVGAQSAAKSEGPVRKAFMPVWLKILLIVLGVILLGIGGIGLGVYVWWQKQGASLIATIGEGTRFGADKDRPACVSEAVVRIKRGGGFTEAVKVQLFFEECLKAARPVAGFCDNVPAKSEFVRSATWLEQMNQKYGLKQTYEKGLLSEIQKFCDAEAGRP